MNGYNRLENRESYASIEVHNFQEILSESRDSVEFKIWGLRESKIKTFFYHFICVLFLGIPYFILSSYPKVKKIKFNEEELKTASVLLVCDNHGQYKYIKIKTENVSLPNINQLRYFFHQHTKYLWDANINAFVTLDQLIPSKSVDDYLKNTDGLTNDEYQNSLDLYGFNKIEVEIKSYWTLFIEEILNPFYAFQVCSIILWSIDDYAVYAACIVILTLFSSVTSLLQTRKQSEALHDLIESSKCHEVTVIRKKIEGNQSMVIDPYLLVPGDLIVLPASKYIMPCDAVLLTGQCIVNESVLTGESLPVKKPALQSSTEIYNIETHKRHTIFSGTTVNQTRYYKGEHVLARVVRTGFDTTKGSLVKSILFPAPVGLKFYKDSMKFVLVLFVIATIGMSYCLYLYISRSAPLRDIIIRSLDLITIVVPPALPAAMAVGTVYSQNRLKKLGIFCISPPRINVCGKIKIACFDKTGTLTHDGLEMNCVIPCKNSTFSEPVNDVNVLDIEDRLVQSMAACHSLTRIQNELNGDPLDLIMFRFTNWKLEEPGQSENTRFDMLGPNVVSPFSQNDILQDLNIANFELPYLIGILKEFTFSSTLQCMSVICRDLRQTNMIAFTKGAPEKLLGLCHTESIPKDFHERLSQYTAQGYRVIALAYKDLPNTFRWIDAEKAKRDKIECDLTFLGFLIMHNPLKEETTPVIKMLHNANVRTVMITGDNILTAVSVAYDCHMVNKTDEIFIITVEDNENRVPKIHFERVGGPVVNDFVTINLNFEHHHFAIDGKNWNKLITHFPHIIPNILVKTKVFARFQPEQKTQLIMFFQKLDYIVSMVGDGANDCGALKVAHVGVSLSEAEASVAAPFTSSIKNISCLVYLILEGRCALVTSMAIFKYMALYSLIQFFSVLILYKLHSELADYQFLFVDLIITTSLAITIGRQGPSDKLGPKRPMSSLVAAKNVIPLFLQIIVCASVQISAIFYLLTQSWFTPISSNTVNETQVSWENTVIFTVSCYQYIILAIVYSKGQPYRERLITNFWFLVSALSLIIFITWLIVYPCKFMADLMGLVYIPHGKRVENDFKYTLLVFPLIHLCLAALIEVGMSDREWLKRAIQFLTCKSTPKNFYNLILKENQFSMVNSDIT
ncbi:polyamine-transporting ATPase 13A3-like isoform X1 [Diorhabda sublineata]|uniref:polyamine-transporting ATPase 13A3-like isoform X1 n=1 Tax=Diorhabda sublineata TaxID=1163346 RepID=UPI0024E080D3|nr:polyamine-transporting ATPase 13A3-like isoform X1 [Diorhabda sublineata]